MLSLILRRLLATLPVLVVVGGIVFLLMRFAAGDPAAALAGDTARAADLAAIRGQLGLDRSLGAQFIGWIGQILQGDLGESFFYRQPVASLIASRLEPTVALAFFTLVLSAAVAIPLGTLAALHRGRFLDRLVTAGSVLGFSVPVFVLGYGLVWLFALQLGWLPVQGYQRLAEGPWGFLRHLILPTLALSCVHIALLARMTRAAVLDVLAEDHVRTARAKGLPEWQVVLRHGLRNAAVPIATVFGLGVVMLLGGVVVTESVFNIPGLGRLTVEAVQARDYPTVQAVTLLFAVTYVLVNLLIDLLYVVLDPRIRAR